MKEKFPNETVERLKSQARLEEILPDADQCQACAQARQLSGDVTDLCKSHLQKIYGL